MSNSLGPLLPSSPEAEVACLGAILLKNKLIDDLGALVSPRDFFDERHQTIFSVLQSQRDKDGNKPFDVLTLKAVLEDSGLLQKAGGVGYITGLIDGVPSLTNAVQYANIVREKSTLRQIMESCDEARQAASKSEDSSVKILETLQQTLFDIVKSKYRDFQQLKDIAKEATDRVAGIIESKGRLMGIETGYRQLDNITGGLNDENLIIVGGRPSMGKTAFALSLVQNIAASSRSKVSPVGFFSLEMSRHEIAMRLLSMEARVNLDRLKWSENFPQEDWNKIIQAMDRLREAPIYIDDTPGLTTSELAAKARRMVWEHKVEVLFLDYLQLMEHPNPDLNREQQIATTSRRLKGLSKELNLPIVALTQLNRALTVRSDKRPQLSDIRESGAVEQDADLVCFIHRQEQFDPEVGSPEQEKVTQVMVQKNRHGKTGVVRFVFHPECPRFEVFESSEPDEPHPISNPLA